LAHLPYGPAVRIIRSLAGSSAVQRLIFPRTTKAVDDVYRRGCGIPCDDRTVQLVIMSNALNKMQARKIREFSDREFAHHVRVTGRDIVQDLCASDRGVVLASAHYTLAPAISAVINRLGISPYRLVRSKSGRNHQDRTITTYDKAPFFGLKEVHTILENGGQVYALPDGRQGSFDVAHHFLGHDCNFKAGMFDVARRLGAAIVPVSAYMEIDGRVVVDFHPPLQVDDAGKSEQSPVANLIHEYANLLEAEIRARPWCFDPRRLALFWSGTGPSKADNVMPKGQTGAGP